MQCIVESVKSIHSLTCDQKKNLVNVLIEQPCTDNCHLLSCLQRLDVYLSYDLLNDVLIENKCSQCIRNIILAMDDDE